MQTRSDFVLETLVDFPDDALSSTHPVTPEHIEHLFRQLRKLGVSRVIWAFYGDGQARWIMPHQIAGGVTQPGLSQDQNQWANYAQTLAGMPNPLKTAAAIAHKLGMEIYAYFKPYETGPGATIPNGFAFLHEGKTGQNWLPTAGGRLVWLDPFVAANPHLRLKRFQPDQSDQPRTIRTIALTKSDAAPTRLTHDRIRIWTSRDNASYRPLDQPFTFSETIESAPADVFDIYNNCVTRKGDEVRVIRLSGLSIDEPFIAITTTFEAGEPDFKNAWHELLKPLDEKGQPIEGVYATGSAIWFAECEQFPAGGLMFDTGRGPQVVALDQPTASAGEAKQKLATWGSVQPHAQPTPHLPHVDVRAQIDPPQGGLIAFSRGRCAHLSGALCETAPEVRAYWLKCISDILDAGVDGIEVRVENHSSHSDFPHEYGFNEAVLDRVEDKSQLADPETAREAVTPIRTAAYTQFLREAHELTQARSCVLRANLNLDWFRPADERPGGRKIAYPANIEFDWPTWLREGLVDAAMLRMFAKPFAGIWEGDATAAAMIAACSEHAIPLSVNRYVWANDELSSELNRVMADSRFAGFVLYEAWSFAQVMPEGRWPMITPELPCPVGSDEALWSLKQQAFANVEKACRTVQDNPG